MQAADHLLSLSICRYHPQSQDRTETAVGRKQYFSFSKLVRVLVCISSWLQRASRKFTPNDFTICRRLMGSTLPIGWVIGCACFKAKRTASDCVLICARYEKETTKSWIIRLHIIDDFIHARRQYNVCTLQGIRKVSNEKVIFNLTSERCCIWHSRSEWPRSSFLKIYV